MKIFENLESYNNVAKVGDIIVLGGSGIMDGLKNVQSKHDCFKVTKLNNEGFVSFRTFRGKKDLKTRTEQQIGLLDKTFYNQLNK